MAAITICSDSLVLYNFWWLCGGVNGDLPQDGLCHTQHCFTQSPLPLKQATADLYLRRRHSNTVLSQSLWGLWVLMRTRFVWALWVSLAGMGFDSKQDFTHPSVLLGLLLCPWTWDISSKSLQQDIRGWYTMYLTGLKLSPAFLRQTLPPSACGILDNHF